MRTPRFIIFIALILTACEAADNDATAIPDTLVVQRVDLGPLDEVVPAVGEVQPANRVDIGSEIGGRVIEVLAFANDTVERGQLIARLDPRPHQASLSRARANLSIARASIRDSELALAEAERALARGRELHARGTLSNQSIETLSANAQRAEADVARNLAGVALSEQQVLQAQLDLARTEVRSPIDGFILERRVEVGQTINAMTATPVLFVVANDLSDFHILARVSEADIGKIEIGMPVRFEVEAYPGMEYTGEVFQIERMPIRQNRFVSYPVIIAAGDQEQRLFPGMTASVEFVSDNARRVVRAPREALSVLMPQSYEPDAELILEARERFGYEGDDRELIRAFVMGQLIASASEDGMRPIFVWSNGRVEVRPVHVGGASDTYFEVASGSLSVGELVVVEDRSIYDLPG